MSTTKRKIRDITTGPPSNFLAVISNLNVIARDTRGAAKVIGPNISVNPHGNSNLNNVELASNINPLELRLGDEVLVTKVHDRFVAYAVLPLSQRTGAPGGTYGLGVQDTGGIPQPTNVVARISGKWLKIEWDAIPSAAYYQVVRSANQSTTDATSEILTETSATSYDTRHRGEDADPTMWYSVVAVDKNSRASYMSDWVQPSVEGAAEGAFYSATLTSSVSGELIISNSSGTLRTQFRTHNSPTPFVVEINDPAAGHSNIQPIANSSILYMADKNGNKVYVKVSSGTNKDSYWAYKCTKVSPASGTNRTIAAGTTVINYGVSGKGYIYLTADNANAPFVSVRTHTADSGSYPIATAPLELVRMGNLNGNWGYVADTYGFAVGQYAANQPNITIDTTNGLRIRSYTTNVLTLDTSGNASFSGSITASGGAIGGFDIGADYIRDAANSFGLASTVTGGDDVRFWAGATFANRAAAPFRATEAGAVTATNITITGGAIDGAVINNLSITAGKIGNLEITAAQIANSTITGAKIDSGTITGGNIASGTITGGNIANLAITAGLIANLTITASQIANLTITGGPSGKIATSTITRDNIVAATITATEIAAGTITASNIASGTITASNIASGTITATQLSATAIDSMTITGATIRTASSGARILENTTGLFGYDATNGIFAIPVSGVTWNSESISAGDMVIGYNGVGGMNLKYISGQFSFRTATTDYITFSGRSAYGQNDSGFSTEVLTATGATGTNQDLDSTGFGSGGSPFYTNFVRVTSTGNWTLRSIVTGVDGQWLFLINESANNMTIANAGAAPAGYSAIRTFDGSSPTTKNAGCALFIYNQTNNTWELMSYRG